MYDLTPIEIDGTRITPVQIQPAGQMPKVKVTVTGPTGKAVRRARSFRGEMAHMDAERYVGDVAAELRHAARGW